MSILILNLAEIKAETSSGCNILGSLFATWTDIILGFGVTAAFTTDVLVELKSNIELGIYFAPFV